MKEKKISIAMYSTVKGKAFKGAQLELLVPRLVELGLLNKCYAINRRDVEADEEYYRLSRIPVYINLIVSYLSKIFRFPYFYARILAQHSFGSVFSKEIAKDKASIVYCHDKPHSIVKQCKQEGKKVLLEYGELHCRTMYERLIKDYEKYNIKSRYIYTNKYYVGQAEKSIEIADKILVLSNETKRSFIENGVEEKKLVVVNLGLTKRYDNEYHSRKPFAFISTAHHSFVKGTHNLLLAWRLANITDIPLILVGAIGDDINEFIAKNGPFDNVIFVGYQNVDKYYQAYNAVGILVSLAEGCPRSVIEYLGNGFPVIVTPCATCDVVVDGDNGFVVDYDNIEQIADKLSYFSNNKNQFNIMGQSARQLDSLKNMSDYVNEVVDILENL